MVQGYKGREDIDLIAHFVNVSVGAAGAGAAGDLMDVTWMQDVGVDDFMACVGSFGIAYHKPRRQYIHFMVAAMVQPDSYVVWLTRELHKDPPKSARQVHLYERFELGRNFVDPMHTSSNVGFLNLLLSLVSTM